MGGASVEILKSTFVLLYICLREQGNLFISLSSRTLGGECGYVFGFHWFNLQNIRLTPILEHPTRMMEDMESASSSITGILFLP